MSLHNIVSISKSSGFQWDLSVDACGWQSAWGMSVFEALKPALLLPFKWPITAPICPYNLARLTLKSRCAIPAMCPQPKLCRICLAELHRQRLMDRFAIDCLACHLLFHERPVSTVEHLFFGSCHCTPLFLSWDLNPPLFSPFKKSSSSIWEKIRLVAFNFYPFISRSSQIPGQLPHDLQTARSLSLSLLFFLSSYLCISIHGSFRGMRGIIA